MPAIKPTLGLAKPVWKFFLPLVLLAVLAYMFFPVASLPFVILALYVLYFFRDPERKTPNIPNSVSSPADGKVVSVLEVPCEQMPRGRAQRVAIFLNIFNVHVQRTPFGGVVRSVEHRAGKCLNALNEKCSEDNEAVTVWLDTELGPIGVRQIAGAIARRIVCNVENGDVLARGDRYGLIQFGSRVELFLPMTATVKVQPGQKVKGGETCLAVLYEEHVRKGMSREQVSKLAVEAEAC